MDMIFTLGFLIVFMIILIFLSGWFSGSETALTNLNSSQIKRMKRNGMKNSDFVTKLKKNMDKTLITILIGNNIVNIVLSSVAALIANQLFAEIGVSIMIGVITFLVIIFGEITPKNSAIFSSMEVANRNARAIYYLSIFLTPLIIIFRGISRFIIRMKGYRGESENLLTTDEDIKDLVTLSEEEGVIKPIEREIIHRVFKFGDRKVKDAMVKMENVFCLDDDIVVEGVKSSVKNCGFTRVPVIGDDGKILGLIYSKDLILADDDSIPSLMRKPFLVKESEDVTVVFDKMKENRVHLGIVENSKREHIGIVTLEDLLEELVGELHDEYFDKKYSKYPLKKYQRDVNNQ